MRPLGRERGKSSAILGDEAFTYEAHAFLVPRDKANFDALGARLRESFPIDREGPDPEFYDVTPLKARSSRTVSRQGIDYAVSRLAGGLLGKRSTVTERRFVEGYRYRAGGATRGERVWASVERRDVVEARQRRVTWRIADDGRGLDRTVVGLTYNVAVDERLSSALESKKTGVWARGDVVTAFVARPEYLAGDAPSPALAALGKRLAAVLQYAWEGETASSRRPVSYVRELAPARR